MAKNTAFGFLLVVLAASGCDGVTADCFADNDCDLDICEQCVRGVCLRPAEICHDGIDNDCNGFIDENCPVLCGNGSLDEGELCDTAIPDGDGACPTAEDCLDQDPCTHDELTGYDCQSVCSRRPIDEALDGDGCCPPGETHLTDSDCEDPCGNGVLDPDEACDSAIAEGPGRCPSPEDCVDDDDCTIDHLEGQVCQAHCVHDTVTQAIHDDSCCPSGQDYTTDSDCPDPCGNGVLEPDEICDTAIEEGPGRCPLPSECRDEDPCTSDRFEGQDCQAQCVFVPVTEANQNDSCCPPGLDHTTDSDCPLPCGVGAYPCDQGCCPWIAEVAIAEDSWSDITAAMGTDDQPRFVYIDDRGNLKLGFRSGGQFMIEGIETSGNVDDNAGADIALDSDNVPFVSYIVESSPSERIVRLADRNDGVWAFQDAAILSPADLCGGGPAVALDLDDRPGIVYSVDFQTDDCELLHSVWTGSEWINEVIDTTGSPHGRKTMLSDDLGVWHTAYLIGDYLKYGYSAGATWIVTTIAIDTTYAFSLALHPDNTPHFSYIQSDELKHTLWDGSAWISETVDKFGRNSVSLAVDSAGHPHIVYAGNYLVEGLRYARYDGNSWEISAIDLEQVSSCALVLDGNDRPHILAAEVWTDLIRYHTW